MINERPVPVETVWGALDFRRDSVVIEHISWKARTLWILCWIDADWLKGYSGTQKDIAVVITFDGVVSMFHAELDTYEAIDLGAFTKAPSGISNLELIEGSHYERDLPIRPDGGAIRHYRFWTYDDVFDVLAASVDIRERPRPTAEAPASS